MTDFLVGTSDRRRREKADELITCANLENHCRCTLAIEFVLSENEVN